MTFLLKKMILPLAFGGLAAVTAFGWQQYSNFSNTITLVLGCAFFCILLALWNYGSLSWQSNQMRKKLAAIFGLEDDLLRRINDIETGQSNAEIIESLHNRIEALEETLASNNNASIPAETYADEVAKYDDDKIVMLQSNRAFTDRLQKKPIANKRSINQAVAKSLCENAVSIRLQPIVNLMTKEICAVEAFPYLLISQEWVPATDCLGALNDTQLCQLDRNIVHNLAKVSRKMDADVQAMPIYFTLVSLGAKKHETWQEITCMLKADAKLAAVLVPQIPLASYQALNEEKSARFLELKEYGLKPTITGCSGVEAVMNIATQKRITNFKIPVDELLKYTAREGERIADVLLPKLSKLGIEPIATHIEKAHQAANLIDLDVTLGQGDFISTARVIDLGDGTEPSSIAATNDA